jgi:hypothetical protein
VNTDVMLPASPSLARSAWRSEAVFKRLERYTVVRWGMMA